jgi:hypothetical protein
VTDQTSAPPTDGQPSAPPGKSGFPLTQTLLWVAVAGASAAVTYVALRALLRPAPAVAGDETADRIQALIDEANRLIKTLDEKKQT